MKTLNCRNKISMWLHSLLICASLLPSSAFAQRRIHVTPPANGSGTTISGGQTKLCPRCHGNGWIGIDGANQPRGTVFVLGLSQSTMFGTIVRYTGSGDFCDYCNGVGYVPRNGWRGNGVASIPTTQERVGSKINTSPTYTAIKTTNNGNGDTYGCHSCGGTNNVNYQGVLRTNWTADHKIPVAISDNVYNGPGVVNDYFIYPHCNQCASTQGGKVSNRLNEFNPTYANLAAQTRNGQPNPAAPPLTITNWDRIPLSSSLSTGGHLWLHSQELRSRLKNATDAGAVPIAPCLP